MSDPATIGSIASIVLSIASEAALKGAVGEAVKDAYKALKEKISHCAAGDLEALERNPVSAPRRAVLAEVIDQLPETDKISVQALATALAEALKKTATEGPIGFDVGRLEAARVQLGTLNVHEGVGFRAEEVKTAGDFELKELNVGKPPGKAAQ
jgi:hypothetical protein